MIVPRFLAGFAGHRTLNNPQLVSNALQDTWQRLKERVETASGKLEIYSSIASGADTLAVETARGAGLPVHVIIPKPVITLADGTIETRSGFAEDFWSNSAPGHQRPEFRREDWDRAFKQIAEAKSGTGGGSLHLSRGSQNSPECYYDVGLEILERCDVLIAVWDGRQSRGLGGTAQMVAYARNIGLPLIIIAADTGSITEERLERFCAQDDAGSRIIREVDGYIEGCAKASASERDSSEYVFRQLEACSIRESKRFRDRLVRVIIVHSCATFVAAVGCVLPHHSAFWTGTLAALVFVEFCMVAWALWQSDRLKRSDAHRRWMETRFAAELVRALRTSGGLLDPLHPLITRHDPRWRRFAITLGLMIWREQHSPWDWHKAREIYVAERLRNPEMRYGQITYFQEKQVKAERYFHKTARLGRRFTMAAALFVFGALVYKSWMWLGYSQDLHAAAESPAHGWGWRQAVIDVTFRLMPIALPLAAGMFISLRFALDSGRRTYRYKELTDFLGTSATRLEALQSEASVRRGVESVEEVLLDELVEWRLAELQNGEH